MCIYVYIDIYRVFYIYIYIYIYVSWNQQKLQHFDIHMLVSPSLTLAHGGRQRQTRAENRTRDEDLHWQTLHDFNLHTDGARQETLRHGSWHRNP